MNINIPRWLAMLLLSFAAVVAQAQNLDKIVAVVNEQTITQKKLEARINVFSQQLAHDPNAPKFSREQIREQVLQSLINETIIRQFCENNQLMPEPRDVDNALRAQINESGKSPAEFEKMLISEGLTMAILREQIQLQIMASIIRNQILAPDIKVRLAETEAFLSERLGDPTQKREVNIAHLVVKVPEKADFATKSRAREKIDKALADIRAGQEFSDVAARVSEFSDASSGGLIGWRAFDRLPDIYQQALQQLKVGQNSAVLESPNGFHLIKLIDERARAQQIVERIRARHILRRVDERTPNATAQNEIDTIYQQLLRGESFADLAKRFSQDGSASIGGDLGWLYPGDTVAEFEAALGKLKVNEISPPIRSSFGWHIIQMQDRESVPLPEDKARQIANKVLTEDKMNLAFKSWLEEQMARAFIKIY